MKVTLAARTNGTSWASTAAQLEIQNQTVGKLATFRRDASNSSSSQLERWQQLGGQQQYEHNKRQQQKGDSQEQGYQQQ
jgi:hypothetical protein